MPTLSRAVNDFLLKLGSDGVKQTTLVWYSNKLVAMLREIDDLSIDAISNNLMRGYIAKNLYGRDYKLIGDHHNKAQVKGALSPAYIRGHIRALKMFWSWATSEYELRRSPMDGVAMPRNAKPIPKAIKDESARALLDTCDNSPRGKRDRAIIMLLLDTGARAAGIRQLSLDDIRWADKTAFVFEKGDKGRIVYFSNATSEALQSWLEVRPQEATTVFCSLRTGVDIGSPFGESALNQMLESRAKLARIPKPYNPHSFRHSFARRWLTARGNPSTLALIMGHSTTQVTMNVYGVFSMHEAAQAFQELGLMEKLLNK